MTLTIRPGEPPGRALGRLARAQLGKAADTLNDDKQPVGERIHEMRTSLKKVRALLRLARPLGDRRLRRKLRRVERRMRDLAARTAELRDAEVVLKTLDGALAAAPGVVKPASVEPAREQLLTSLQRAEMAFHGSPAAGARQQQRRTPIGQAGRAEDPGSALSRLADLLRREQRLTHQWAPLSPRSWRKSARRVSDGVARMYRRARRAMKAAYEQEASQARHPSDETTRKNLRRTGAAFHDWRKAVKAHRYQLQFLAGTWPAFLTARLPDLERLGDLLGEEHDVTVLQLTLAGLPNPLRDPATRDRLADVLSSRQRQLRAEARPLGQRLFGPRTRNFRRQLRLDMASQAAAHPPTAGTGATGGAARAGFAKLTAV